MDVLGPGNSCGEPFLVYGPFMRRPIWKLHWVCQLSFLSHSPWTIKILSNESLQGGNYRCVVYSPSSPDGM